MVILYEDKDIIVIKKPAGLATQSASISSKDCVSLLKKHLTEDSSKPIKGEPYLGLIHRLDQPVAGVLVFAKNDKAAADLSKQVQTDDMKKHYYALVEGKCENAVDKELVNYLYKDAKNSMAVIVENIDKAKVNKNIKIQKAVLFYSTFDTFDKEITGFSDSDDYSKFSLLGISLKTGRFHQIRSQLSAMGHPIAGDKKYGSKEPCPSEFAMGAGNNRGAIALVADKLSFIHPTSGKKMEFNYF